MGSARRGSVVLFGVGLVLAHRNGIRWPRQITITQDGRAYQELTLQAFEATLG